jgi:hypothetical protein
MSSARDPRDDAARAAEVPADLVRLLQHVQRPAARPEFRATLREAFLAGAAAAGPVDARTAPERTVPARTAPVHTAPARTAPARTAPVHTAPVRPRRHLLLLAGALTAAAVIVLILQLTRTRAPLWIIHGSSTADSIVVDGIAMTLGDGERLTRAISTARELEVHGGPLRLCVRDETWIELADGTRLSQMQFAAAGPYRLRADRGSVRIATLPAFAGRGLRIVTPDLDASVTGTAFAVDVNDECSCVCTLEGSVDVQPDSQKTATPVTAGHRCLVYRDRDRGPVEWQSAFEQHLAPVRALLP